jgi:uncharacterized protein YjiS (DUF1127 family)
MTFINAIGAFIQGLFEAISQGRRAHDRYFKLSMLSDRELQDMGIARGDIPNIAFSSKAWR